MNQKSVTFKDGAIEYTVTAHHESGEVNSFVFSPNVSTLTMDGILAMGDSIQKVVFDIDEEFSDSEQNDQANANESGEAGEHPGWGPGSLAWAQNAMLDGKKVRHESYLPGECRSMPDAFTVCFQNGTLVSAEKYFEDKTGPEWQTGWSLVEE